MARISSMRGVSISLYNGSASFKQRLFYCCLLVPLLVALSCSKSTDPRDGGNSRNGDGRLEGEANDNAVARTDRYLAVAAPVLLVGATGMLANKVFTAISPFATVGQVNRLLDSLGAKIICMDAGSVFLTLLIPAVNGKLQLDSVTTRLAESEPFLFAFPCFLPIPPPPAAPDPAPGAKIIPGDPAAGNIPHLTACFMPAAWNSIDLAGGVGRQVSVLVPDAYAQLSAIAEIPSQEFVPIQGDGADIRVFGTTAAGNHGFYVCGILGAEFNDFGVTGIHPGDPDLIKIRSLNIGSDEWGIKLQQMSDAIPSTSQTIVSTSFGYNDPTFATVSKWQRVLLALRWRELVGAKQSQFLHATSAGNDGNESGEGSLSIFNSPFTMAAQMVSPWDWLGAGEYTQADSIGFEQLKEQYGVTKPYILQPLINVLIVGSSRLSGTRATTSSLGEDIRFVGEEVFSPCLINDQTCIDGFGTPSGTSMATPQAAGLAAYLMNLKLTLTAMQARDIMLNSYDNTRGIVNAYKAVLALDNGLTSATIRKSILNVAGPTGGAAPVFDEEDLLAYFGVLEPPSLTRNFDAFDLNGDGYSGGSSAAPFDLTADSPPAFTTVDKSYCGEDTTLNENALTDMDILKYYAYSSLYSGDPSVRDSLFACGILAEITMPATLRTATPAPVVFQTWRLSSTNTRLPLSGADLEISVEGATPLSLSGTTDGSGTYAAQITPLVNADTVRITMQAKLYDVVVAADTATAVVEKSSGKVKLTSFIARTRSYAAADPYGQPCDDEKMDTLWEPTFSSEATNCNAIYSNDTLVGSAVTSCSRDVDIASSGDSAMLTIMYEATMVSSAQASAPTGIIYGAFGVSQVDMECLFSVIGSPVSASLTVQYNLDGSYEQYFYVMQLSRVDVGVPQLITRLDFSTGDPKIVNEVLHADLPVGNYQLMIYSESAASGDAYLGGGSRSSTANSTEQGVITIGAPPIAP